MSLFKNTSVCFYRMVQIL